jgi:polysaccharide biosynthesis transport protein
MSDYSLHAASSSERGGRSILDESGDFADEAAPVNPLARLQLLLYGRYTLAIILGLILGIGCAVAAFMSVPTKYEIVGYIRVKPYLAKILYQSDENGMLPSFDTFVDLQESLIQSQRVLDRASQNPDWLALNRTPSTPGASSINTDALVVDHAKGTELITVSATDRDLNAAMAAVKSVLQAYLEISGETEGEGDAHRLQVLEDLRTSLANQARGIHDRILSMANEYGTDDLSQRHQMKAEEVNRLDDELQEITLSLSMAQPGTNGASQTAPASQPSATKLTREAVAEVDSRMRDYIAAENRVTLELDQLQTEMGDKNSEVVTKRKELASIDQHISDLLAEHQQAGDILPQDPGRDRSRMSPAELLAQQANVRALFEKAQSEALDLGRKDLQLRDLKDEQTAVNKRLDEASDRINQLNLESSMASRISILSYGEKPTTPPKNKRAPLTAAVGIGGFAAGVGLVALWGFFDPRVRSVQHAQHLEPTVRMLGVLPFLPDGLDDPQQRSLAAHCVHQIRNLLDVGGEKNCRVLAITSATAGDGKTSLSLALGLSFAGTGSRTLLIDGDMVGGGMTGRLNAITRRGVGAILLSNGSISEKQLAEAQQIADSSNRKLSQVLGELGYVSDADLEQANSAAERSSVGLLNALEGEALTTCVTQIMARNLSILPLGEADAQHTNRLSSRRFRHIIDQARNQYDVVIVDTGPILGSLEASTIVREVDETVLAVACDGQAPLVKHSITMLNSLGVQFAGLVFNRAKPADVAISHYGSSLNSASVRSIQVIRSRAHESRNADSMQLGSLVSAVVNPPANETPVNGGNRDHDG